MGVTGIFMVIEIMRIDKTPGSSYKVRRKKGLGLRFEKNQHLRLAEGNEGH